MNANGEFHSRQPLLIRDPRQRNWNRQQQIQTAENGKSLLQIDGCLLSGESSVAIHFMYLVRVGRPVGPRHNGNADLNRKTNIHVCEMRMQKRTTATAATTTTTSISIEISTEWTPTVRPIESVRAIAAALSSLYLINVARLQWTWCGGNAPVRSTEHTDH